MSRLLKHLFVSIVSAIGGCAVSFFVGLIVWVVLGDNPSSKNPLLLVYQVLFWVIPVAAVVYFNVRLSRKLRQNKSPERNALTPQ